MNQFHSATLPNCKVLLDNNSVPVPLEVTGIDLSYLYVSDRPTRHLTHEQAEQEGVFETYGGESIHYVYTGQVAYESQPCTVYATFTLRHISHVMYEHQDLDALFSLNIWRFVPTTN